MYIMIYFLVVCGLDFILFNLISNGLWEKLVTSKF